MLSDLTARSLHSNAYSDLPFTFLDQAAQNDLANITAIDLIENGDRTARENWQNRQLTKLLRHAQARSKFWRQRMPSRMINHGIMKYLPIQSREDIATQMKLEGSLVARDGKALFRAMRLQDRPERRSRCTSVRRMATTTEIRSASSVILSIT